MPLPLRPHLPALLSVLLLVASCAAVPEVVRPDHAPAVTDARGTTAVAVERATTRQDSAARALAEERRLAVQEWVDAMQVLAEALELAVPRVRAPEREHFPAARGAIARVMTLSDTVAEALPESAAGVLAQARAHAAQAAWAGEVLLERVSRREDESADRAWEAVVLHWNNWRAALLEALEDEVLVKVLGGAP